MSRLLYGNFDLVTNQILNVRLQMLGGDPSPLEAQIYYNSTAKEIRYHNGTNWIALGPAGAGGPPTGGAGGDLAGSYPTPTIALLAVTDAKVAAANKDGAAGTYSMRTLGTGATQAAAGNDSRFSDSRNPTGTAGGDLTGTYPNPGIAAGVIVDNDVNASANIAQSKIATLVADLAARLNIANPTVTSGDLTLFRDPTSGMHAATKQYVDLTSQGLDYKASVKAASTVNLTLSGAQTVDGVAVTTGDRVLVKDQSTASANGIYLANTGAWTRTTDADASGEISDGTLVPVEGGTLSSDSLWLCISTTATPWVPASSGSTWTKFSSLNELVAGAGLVKTGTTLDIASTTGDLTVNADSLTVNSAPKWTTARTISLTGDVTGSTSIDGTGNVSIATVGGGKRYAVALGTASPQTVTHNLNTRDVTVQVYNGNTPYEEIDVEVEHTSVNVVTLKHNPALPAGYRCVVLG